MKVYCNGAAIIEHKDTGIQYKIEANQLDWQSNGGGERNMGTEHVYEAEIEHNELGILMWSLYEYPVGVFNYSDENFGGHKLIKNFDYGLEHEDE